MSRFFRGKSAVSPWIAWVLLVAFAIVLSAFMYSFMVDYTNTSSDDVKKVIYNTDECRRISVNVDSACIDVSGVNQYVNITLRNSNYIRIDSMDFRYYVGRVPKGTVLTDIAMNPNRIKTVMNDTGISSSDPLVTMIEVIPHVFKDNIDIICADRKAQYSGILTCS